MDNQRIQQTRLNPIISKRRSSLGNRSTTIIIRRKDNWSQIGKDLRNQEGLLNPVTTLEGGRIILPRSACF